MGTLVGLLVGAVVLVTGTMAFLSWRRHSLAAQARSDAAMTLLMEEAYRIAAAQDARPAAEADPAVDEDSGPSEPGASV
ncbi:MAG: hypothetical protein IPO93_13220 [Actinobacteria bacterium]|jgi:hypothetical protein|nr:hypothetical protein [Actinomycetota bacterium]